MTRDLRKYASQTNVQLIGGALLILFIIGLGLIAWLYGTGAGYGKGLPRTSRQQASSSQGLTRAK